MATRKINCTADDFSRLAAQLSAEILADIAFVGDGIEVSEERYDEILAALDAGVPDSVVLKALKSDLCDAVDRAAEQERCKYITSGAGQAMTYVQKADEASRFLMAEDPDATEYPLLAAEVGITAPTIGGVATVVFAAYQSWQQLGAAIEAVRLGSKKAINAAETTEHAIELSSGIVWPG